MAKLPFGCRRASHGRREIDSKSIRHRSANELRRYFGMVPQETYLFSGTIYENLVPQNPNAGFGNVVQACKVAEIHETIEKLPQGYSTVIGEHGVGLSGVQKQRLAIAREVPKRPRILMFDEATSGLDQQTTERFAQTVNQLKEHLTVLFVVHQVPRSLVVDEVFAIGGDKVTRMSVVGEIEGKSHD